MTSAKRGQEWEEICSRSFAVMDNCTVMKMGAPVRVIRFIKRGPGRKAKGGEFVGYFEGKGSCDYEGGYRGVVASLEAKRTKQPRWPLASIKPHQIDRMRSTVNMGGVAGVLLCWDHDQGSTAYFGISFEEIDRWMRAGKKSIKPGDLQAGCDVMSIGVKMLTMRPASNNGKFYTVCSLYPFMDMMISNVPRGTNKEG